MKCLYMYISGALSAIENVNVKYFWFKVTKSKQKRKNDLPVGTYRDGTLPVSGQIRGVEEGKG